MALFSSIVCRCHRMEEICGLRPTLRCRWKMYFLMAFWVMQVIVVSLCGGGVSGLIHKLKGRVKKCKIRFV